MLERNSMCKLPTRSSGLRKILRCLKKKEIIEMKQEECVLPGSKKIIGSYMGESSYASVARSADRTNEDTKYRTLVEKLIQMEANDWPKFHE